MISALVAAFAGLLFALGLAISGMTDPSKVRGFLDFTGHWDPRLIAVMLAAISVHALLLRWIGKRRQRPLFSPEFSTPARRRVDLKLVLGASLFGVGWGIAGYCPGPAWVSLFLGRRGTLLFVLGMLLGLFLFRVLQHAQTSSQSRKERAQSSC